MLGVTFPYCYNDISYKLKRYLTASGILNWHLHLLSLLYGPEFPCAICSWLFMSSNKAFVLIKLAIKLIVYTLFNIQLYEDSLDVIKTVYKVNLKTSWFFTPPCILPVPIEFIRPYSKVPPYFVSDMIWAFL